VRGNDERRDLGGDRLQAAGWRVEVANARKVKGLAPLACKTDKVDARLLAELCRRDLVPAVWLSSFDDRALRERLNRRMHLVRMRTMARNRIHGVLTQWGLKIPVARLREPGGLTLLETQGCPRCSAARSLRHSLSSTGSTDVSRRSSRSCFRSLARTRAWCCWRRSPASGRCSV
jgi:transposase